MPVYARICNGKSAVLLNPLLLDSPAGQLLAMLLPTACADYAAADVW
jgi:hypothetical protein